MGIAERETEADNAAFTNMAAVVVLRDAIRAAEKLGRAANPEWEQIAKSLVLPKQGDVIVSHDGFQPDEEKGGTPDPLMGSTRSASTWNRTLRRRPSSSILACERAT
jgi:cytoskeletal protein RodZ